MQVRTRSLLAALAASSIALGAGAACSSFNSSALTGVVGPDYGQFAGGTQADGAVAVGVSAVLERRCGTLDCHGQVGRPLRIYGSFGLRFVDGDASNRPGLQPTTDTEHQANYQSVIGLQPELMTEVVQGNAPPEALMLLRKPLGLERHEGGQVFVGGDQTYTCFTSWLSGQVDSASCQGASQ